MPEFTVQKIKQIDQGTGKNGKPWTKQKVRLDTSDGPRDVLLFCTEWAPVPAEGGTLEGEIGKPFREGQLPEFERAKKSFNGRGGGNFKADPEKLAVEREKNRAIAMESSVKASLEIVRIAHETGATPAEVQRLVEEIAPSVYELVRQKIEAA